MKKTDFLQQLDLNLQALGIAPDVIGEQVDRVRTYLEENAMEEIDINPAEMARGIADTLGQEQDDGEAADGDTPDDDNVTDAENGENGENGVNAETDEYAAGDDSDTETDSTGAAAENGADTGAEAASIDDALIAAISVLDEGDRRVRAIRQNQEADVTAEQQPDTAGADAGNTYAAEDGTETFDDDGDMKIAGGDNGFGDNADDIKKYTPPDTVAYREPKHRAKRTDIAENEAQVYGKDTEDEGSWAENIEKAGGKPLFWTLFCIAVPFAVVLAVAIAFIYVVFWVVLAALMIFSIAGMIAFIAAGAVVSLTGIVYGVVQLVKGLLPVALFEIGLGITVGAVVMLVGILIYNFAIRLIPFAMKQLARLVGFSFRKGREAFIAAKGACEKL